MCRSLRDARGERVVPTAKSGGGVRRTGTGGEAHSSPITHTATALALRSASHASNVRAEPRQIRGRISESDVSIRPDQIESAVADARVARRLVPREFMKLDAEGGAFRREFFRRAAVHVDLPPQAM